ncbi:MAG: hypothetical protein OXT09_33315 [Myxococcales bacterium]|nr:hypothetical protein [Myxococcales bacterium]
MSTSATLSDEALDATADTLLELLRLVRQVNTHGEEHPMAHSTARSLFEAIDAAVPPISLSFVGAAVLRGKEVVPLDQDLYRRSQTLAAALQKYGMHQIRFDTTPPIATLIDLAKVIIAGTHGKGKARIAALSGISFHKLLIFGDEGAKDEATVDAFVEDQVRRAIVETEAVITRDESKWPWRTARAPLSRLERCTSISVATTMRTFDLVPGVATRGRRVLAAAFITAAVLTRLGVADRNRRPAAHATLALACHGFDDREGIQIEEAAKVAMGALSKSRLSHCDPHALRTCALVRAIERTNKGVLHPSVLPLIRIAYDLERHRTPLGLPFELTRLDLWSWLSDRIAEGAVHAGWGRAVIDTLGLVPAGAHVMADGRLAAVAAGARADDPLRPPVVANGELKAPETAVQAYSPLAMTPWAKGSAER